VAYRRKRKYKMTHKHKKKISQGLKRFHSGHRKHKKKKHQYGTPYSGTFYGYAGYPFGFSGRSNAGRGGRSFSRGGGGGFKGGGHR